MTAAAAAAATSFILANIAGLATASRRAGMPPAGLSGAVWLAARDAATSGQVLKPERIFAAAVRAAAPRDLVSRPHRGPRARRDFGVEIDDICGGDDPLLILLAAEALAARRQGWRGAVTTRCARTVRRARGKARAALAAGQLQLALGA